MSALLDYDGQAQRYGLSRHSSNPAANAAHASAVRLSTVTGFPVVWQTPRRIRPIVAVQQPSSFAALRSVSPICLIHASKSVGFMAKF